jgi:hypothetical protein
VSHHPCSNLYCGSSAGSEPETKVMQSEARRLASTLEAYVTLHSHVSMVLFPYGSTVNHTLGSTCLRAPDHDELVRTMDLINVFFTFFVIFFIKKNVSLRWFYFCQRFSTHIFTKYYIPIVCCFHRHFSTFCCYSTTNFSSGIV